MNTADRMSKLTPKQAAFVQEYLVDLNGTQAAIRAGYSPRTANEQAARALAKASIQAAIQAAMKKREERTQITQDKVLKELAMLGFANMGDYMRTTADGDPYLDFSKLTREQTAALQEVTVDDYLDGRGEDARAVRKVKFKLADKRAALVDIGKHLGMFTEKLDHTSSDGTMSPKSPFDGMDIDTLARIAKGEK